MITNEEYVEDTIRPIPLWGMLILWSACGYVMVSAAVLFFYGSVPEWGLFDTDDYGSALFCGSICTMLIVVFTLFFIFFRGMRFRLYLDRIEYQKGHAARFSKIETLQFDNLDAVQWKVTSQGDENKYGTTFIEFLFPGRRFPFQLHKTYDLDSTIAEACKEIERKTLATRMLKRLENGETLYFPIPKRYPTYEIRIDHSGIMDWDQNRLEWKEIQSIRFSKGDAVGYDDYLTQCRIHFVNTSDAKLSVDMPNQNPHAFWAVCLAMIDRDRIEIINAPKDAK